MAEIFLSVSFVSVEPDLVEQCNIKRKMHCSIGTENMSKALPGHHGQDKTDNFIFTADGIFYRYTL